MDCNDKINAHITTIGFNLNDTDVETNKKENEVLMNIIHSMEFYGVNQSLLTEEVDTCD